MALQLRILTGIFAYMLLSRYGIEDYILFVLPDEIPQTNKRRSDCVD